MEFSIKIKTRIKKRKVGFLKRLRIRIRMKSRGLMSSNNSRWIESRGTKLGQDKGRIENWLEKTERKKIKTRKI